MSRRSIIAGKAVIVVEAKSIVDKTLRQVESQVRRLSNTLSSISDRAFMSGLMGTIGSGLLIRQFKAFDDKILELQVSLNKLDPAARRVDQEMISLENTIKRLGAATTFTTTQITEAAIALAKAGISAPDIEKSLESVLHLARGTSTELDVATKIFVRAVRAFSKDAKSFDEAMTNAQQLTSQFVLAVRSGVLDLVDLESALRYVQGTAGSFNEKISTTLALLTELANRGLVGSIGGTSLNTALQQIAKKQDDLRALGVEIALLEDGSLDLLTTLTNLFDVVGQMPLLEKQRILGDLFNLRGKRAIIAAEVISNVKELRKQLEGATKQAKVSAQIMDSSLGGSLRLLSAAVENLALKIGEAVKDELKGIIEAARELFLALAKLIEQNPAIGHLIIFTPPALFAAAIGLKGIAVALGVVATSLGVARAAASSFGNVMAKVTGGQMKTFMATRRGVESFIQTQRGFSAERKATIAARQFSEARRSQRAERFRKLEAVRAKAEASVAGKARNLILAQRELVLANRNAKDVLAKAKEYRRLEMEIWKEWAIIQNTPFASAQNVAARRKRSQLQQQIRNLVNAGMSNATMKKEIQKALDTRRRAIEKATSAASSLKAREQLRQKLSDEVLSTVGKKSRAATMHKTLKRRTFFQGLSTGLKNFLGLILKVGSAFRKLFSLTGLGIILEMLFIFTDLGERIFSGVGSALKDIGTILPRVAGPFKEILAGFRLLAVGDSKNGFEAIKSGFSSIAEIIKNQLVAAWNGFLEKLGWVYQTVAKIAQIFSTIFDFVLDIAKVIASQIMNNLKGFGEILLPKSAGGGFMSGLESVTKAIGFIIVQLLKGFHWINEKFWEILNGFEGILNSFLSRFETLIMSIPGAKYLVRKTEDFNAINLEEVVKRNKEIGKSLDKIYEDFEKNVTKVFHEHASIEERAKRAQEARRKSLQVSEAAAKRAAYWERLREKHLEGIRNQTQAELLGNGMSVSRNPMVKVAQAARPTLEFARALVGSAMSTRGNLLQAGLPIERQQLQEQKKQTEILKKIAKDRGIVFAP
ncbi:MAG: hypothetical protein KatS3mg087_1366 [Patescibacteria group bacterium]|nr:MAG: hypothetical protein KatS3mg087_1366 [Patescibacteria group bacterium]